MINIGDYVYSFDKDRYGTVICAMDYGYSIGVDFGKDFYGHNLNGRLETETGWWCGEEDLELAERKKTNRRNYV